MSTDVEPPSSVRIDLGGEEDELVAPAAPDPGSGSRFAPLVAVFLGIACVLGSLVWLSSVDSRESNDVDDNVEAPSTTASPADPEIPESTLVRGSDGTEASSSITSAQMPRLLDEFPRLNHIASDERGQRILGVDRSMMIHYSSNGVTWRASEVADLPDGRPLSLDFIDGFFVLSVDELYDPLAPVAERNPYRITFWTSADGGFRWGPYGELTPLGPAAIEGTGNVMAVEFTPGAALVYVSDRPDEARLSEILLTKEGTALLPSEAEICGLSTGATDPVEYILSSCVDGVESTSFNPR